MELFDETADVVLLDRQLPEHDGEEPIPVLRGRNPECKLAMLTSLEPELDVLEMDIDAYLTKPVREDDGFVLLEALIEDDKERLAAHDEIMLYDPPPSTIPS